MTRLCVLFCVVACTGGRHVSKIRYTSEVSSACPDDKGCELVTNEARYEPPDEDHAQPPETVAGLVADAPPEAPRDATCADVATSLAVFDVGNHADPAELAPVRAKYETACVRYRFKREERACLFEAREKWHIAYCVPRLVPEAPVPIFEAARCPELTAAVRARHASYGQRVQIDPQLEALQASCEHDRWPHAFAECVRTRAYLGHGAQLAQSCPNLAPGIVTKKLDLRFAAAAKRAKR